MNESEFSNPYGTFQDSNDDADVKTFVPNAIPPTIDARAILSLTAEANRQLGILDGISSNIHDIDRIAELFIRREAVFSSEIEGVYATVADLFEFEAHDKFSAHISKSGHSSIVEVANCATALDDCMEGISCRIGLDLKMIKNAHSIMLNNIWSQDKTPGQFRTIQNWIGFVGSTARTASYVPPAPELLDGLLLQLENFLKTPQDDLPVVVRCALAHSQFESIHPFADGNGRTGRILISLVLADNGILEKPLLCLSEYFVKNQSTYYSHLLNVNKHSDWTGWLKFFLTGVIVQSKKTVDDLTRLMELRSQYIRTLKHERMSNNTVYAVESLFGSPVITTRHLMKIINVTYATSKKIVANLVRLGILSEFGTRKWNKMYVAQEIMDIVEAS